MTTRKTFLIQGAAVLVLFVLAIFQADFACTKTQTPTAEKKPAASPSVQEPCVSGAFYPAEPDKLASMVETYIQNARIPAIKGRVIGAVAPHAGIVYSGRTAGYTYRLVQELKPKKVIVIGIYHGLQGREKLVAPPPAIATVLKDYYRTPLGDVPIDRETLRALMQADPRIQDRPDVLGSEHSLEVQLPFLQKALGTFQLTPILMADQRPESARTLASAIRKALPKGDYFVIASSDMTHYLPADTVKAMDEKAFELMKALDGAALYKAVTGRKAELCGVGPVMTLMELLRLSGGGEAVVLDHSDSGDSTGDKSAVVGYGAVAFAASPAKAPAAPGASPPKAAPEKQSTEKASSEETMKLTREQEKALLTLARNTVNAVVRDKKKPEELSLDAMMMDDTLKQNGAAFVTIKKKGQLRGCIGQLVARQPLAACIRDMATAAATEDPRFPPVSPAELKDLEFEISVLTPMEKVTDISTIEVGKHGLVIRKHWNSGLLLPQVATEYGWNREEFLAQTCRKAGLAPDDWKKDAEIYKFQALVFSEKDID
jgi:AmmeMemoRadiSam system protein B/AmmeMemoRadiSam system protein A